MMSRLHDNLCWLLDEIGVDYEVEVQVGGFRLDCYSHSLHIGFEADGPHHGMRVKKDRERDTWIEQYTGIKILRLTTGQLDSLEKAKASKAYVIQFVEAHMDTAESRRLCAL